MPKFYFTFGMNHLDKHGNSLGQKYVMISARAEGNARLLMNARRSVRWAFSYTEEEFEGQPEMFGLTEVSIDDVTLPEGNKPSGAYS